MLLALALPLAGCVDSTADPDGNTTVEDAPLEPAESEEPGTEEPPAEGAPDEDEGDVPPDEPDDDPPAPKEEAAFPPWPAVSDATIRPGVQLLADGSQCTSNFIFRSPDNRTLYIGSAAHCFADGTQDQTNGCDEGITPTEPGAAVTIRGASETGTLVYSSWYAMQQAGEDRDGVCRFNDFALVAVDPADRGLVHPAMLHFGGPTGLAPGGGVSTLDKLLIYGNSGTRQGIDMASWQEGYVLFTDGDWSLQAYVVTPVIPGDSGSGVLLGDGRAVGLAVTVALTPLPASNGITLLESALGYARAAGMEVELVTWAQFDTGLLP